MIKCFLVLPGGAFPIQIRQRTLKHLAAAMQRDMSIRARYIQPCVILITKGAERLVGFIGGIFKS